MTAEHVVDVSGVVKRYGDFTAVDHVSLSIDKGAIYGLLGPNGAGKTSMIHEACTNCPTAWSAQR